MNRNQRIDKLAVMLFERFGRDDPDAMFNLSVWREHAEAVFAIDNNQDEIDVYADGLERANRSVETYRARCARMTNIIADLTKTAK